MALVTHKFKLDLTPGASRQVLYTSQGDIGRPFEADLYWNGSPWTATGTTANIRGKKPDDTVFDYTATVSGTAVTFETTEQMTIISGPVECELVFSNDGDIIASANFLLIVEASPYDPDALSESDVEGLTDVLESFQRLNRDSNGVVKIGDGVTASGTAEPIKGFYVHDEESNTDGVAKYDYDELVNAPDVKSVFNDDFQIYNDVRPNLESGKFISASANTIENSDNFAITEPIPVKAGQIVRLTATGYNQVIGMIATCNADNTERETVARSIDSSEHEYVYTVESDGFIVCSFLTYNASYKIDLAIDYYALYKEFETVGIVEQGTDATLLSRNIDGYIVNNSGITNSSSNFFISQSITLYPSQKLVLNAKGYNQLVSMISEYNQETDTYKPLVISADSTLREYEYTATKKMTVRCCAQWYKSTYNAVVVTPVTFSKIVYDGIYGYASNAEVNPVIQYPQMFTNIICMGDSLTKGESGGSQSVPLDKNYPHYFKKLTQADITNQSQGGITAQGFWNTYASAFDYSVFDCAVIFLGTNGGLTDTVSTDCHEDYTQNTDNNTGCYGKIIGKIKATAPKCKIFVVAGVNDYIRRATTMNPAVRSLAEFYDVGLIDVENCIMSDVGGGSTEQRYLYRPIDGIHYNALGYMTLANMFYDSMSEFMANNLAMYAD